MNMRIALLTLWLSAISTLAFALEPQDFERQIFEQTNRFRAEQGLPALAYNDDLALVARAHSENMGQQDFFEHEDPEGRLAQDRLREQVPQLIQAGVGENLYMSQRSDRNWDAGHIVGEWGESPDHRKNMLDSDFTHIGVGIFQIGGKLYATQVFARPILKLKTELPKRLILNNSYKLECEYLAPDPGDDFACMLATPDPHARVMVSVFTFYEGLIPVKTIWNGPDQVSLILNFNQGAGTYSLQAGWGEYYFSDLFSFEVN